MIESRQTPLTNEKFSRINAADTKRFEWYNPEREHQIRLPYSTSTFCFFFARPLGLAASVAVVSATFFLDVLLFFGFSSSAAPSNPLSSSSDFAAFLLLLLLLPLALTGALASASTSSFVALDLPRCFLGGGASGSSSSRSVSFFALPRDFFFFGASSSSSSSSSHRHPAAAHRLGRGVICQERP